MQRLGLGWPLNQRAADVGEEHAANAADDADRRQRRLNQREPQLRVGEHRVLPGELQVVVAVQLGVAAEVGEIGEIAEALEPLEARCQQSAAAESQVVAQIGFDSLAR